MASSPVKAAATGIVLVFAFATLGGGCYQGPPPAMGPRTTKHSAVPCVESCGDNSVCRSQCQPVGDLPQPPGLVYQR